MGRVHSFILLLLFSVFVFELRISGGVTLHDLGFLWLIRITVGRRSVAGCF